ncbi:MAG: hypothetical protein IPI35_14150 [Deltaproteobacteria bacterium]|nr:hypothetical protein [Deltaproteobacteria bacterium]
MGTSWPPTCPLFEDQAELFAALPFWDEALKAEPRLGQPPLPWPAWTREAWS